MSAFETPEITPLGATALLVRFGDRIDRDLSLRIARLVDHLDHQDVPGIVDLAPAYTTLIVLFDPDEADTQTIAGLVDAGWTTVADDPDSDNQQARLVEIPVVYGGDAGPDLQDVATATGLSSEEVIRRHSGATYTVGVLGFSPGFAFLIGLPPKLESPRRASPRTRVPPGSVGIGGAQTGIYPLPTPGGWSLIGRTPRVMFDPARASDEELRPGDRIRFVPVGAEDATFPESSGEDESHHDVGSGPIEILQAGVQSSVQDLGRPAQARLGITPGGAADRSALVCGNRLLGNDDSAAGIEWTLLPPAIRFHAPCRVVCSGTDPGWRHNGTEIEIGQIVLLAEGDEFTAQSSSQPVGARGYICVAGGIDVPVVRGSRSLDLSAGFGGGFGRPLKKGDRLPIGQQADNPELDNLRVQDSSSNPSSRPVRVVRGPQADRFDDAAWSTFLTKPFKIDAQSNRMGLRLNGPALMPEGGADVISEGVLTGAIQVTGSGQSIVLLPGRATIGGYTKIAAVIEADHDRLAQLRPNATIRFAEVSLEDATQAWWEMRPSVYGGLRSDSDDNDGKPAMNQDATSESPGLPTDANGWTPAGVIAVIRELANHDVQAFSLRVESAGLEIVIDRGGGLPARPPREFQRSETSPATDPSDTVLSDNPNADHSGVITASLLGTFYRRISPDAPMLVEEGDIVEAGQTVGLIEVMKTYHEVTAPVAGRVTKVIAEDGASVEFGELLMELDPAREE
ncbi:MAG: 5-oxoprolinase subunit PxpB [Chloroflexota bacterium]|nr:5-oxoprolinase subunit PxpB [Chloroflexota bacterium]